MNYSRILPLQIHTVAKVSVALLLALSIAAGRAQAAPADAPEVVRGFYATLLATMMNGPALGPSGRYARLAPAVRRTFDIPFMTRLAVGPGWGSLSLVQQQQVTEAFERYVAAIYADRFDSYSGERLEVAGEQPFGANRIVQTRIVKSNGEPVSINYLVRRTADAWQISDVYLDGTISELATRRADFSAILRDRGIGGLIGELNRKAHLLSERSAKTS